MEGDKITKKRKFNAETPILPIPKFIVRFRTKETASQLDFDHYNGRSAIRDRTGGDGQCEVSLSR